MPGGPQRLVAITFNSRFGKYAIETHVIEFWTFRYMYFRSMNTVWLPQIDVFGGPLRIFNGHPDAEDPTHFMIDFELAGKRGTIDGWLRNDAYADLQVRAAR